jgi:hypothetical protein
LGRSVKRGANRCQNETCDLSGKGFQWAAERQKTAGGPKFPRFATIAGKIISLCVMETGTALARLTYEG